MWRGSLGMLEQAAAAAREATDGRWRSVPLSELRRLEDAIAAALEVSRLAVAIAQERHDLELELTREARAAAEQHAKERRRAGTREAERVRLLNARARREGRELTPEERWPWIYADAAD